VRFIFRLKDKLILRENQNSKNFPIGSRLNLLRAAFPKPLFLRSEVSPERDVALDEPHDQGFEEGIIAANALFVCWSGHHEKEGRCISP
jgi:hypothetical protein